MIPKITQERPNISERFWCSVCGRALPAPGQGTVAYPKDPWKFCPGCGEPIEYEKAEHFQWREQNCVRCGQALVYQVQCNSPYFVATSAYVGAPLCNNCLEEHCMQTNCLQCDIGEWPNCRYSNIKRQGMQKAREEGATNVWTE